MQLTQTWFKPCINFKQFYLCHKRYDVPSEVAVAMLVEIKTAAIAAKAKTTIPNRMKAHNVHLSLNHALRVNLASETKKYLCATYDFLKFICWGCWHWKNLTATGTLKGRWVLLKVIFEPRMAGFEEGTQPLCNVIYPRADNGNV